MSGVRVKRAAPAEGAGRGYGQGRRMSGVRVKRAAPAEGAGRGYGEGRRTSGARVKRAAPAEGAGRRAGGRLAPKGRSSSSVGRESSPTGTATAKGAERSELE